MKGADVKYLEISAGAASVSAQSCQSHTCPFGCWFLFVEGLWVYSGNWDNINNEHWLWADTMRQHRTQVEITEARKPLLTVNCKLSKKN